MEQSPGRFPGLSFCDVFHETARRIKNKRDLVRPQYRVVEAVVGRNCVSHVHVDVRLYFANAHSTSSSLGQSPTTRIASISRAGSIS